MPDKHGWDNNFGNSPAPTRYKKPEQHNHHCRVTFMGCDWFIRRVRKHLVDVIRPVGYGHCFVYTTIDFADVDFESYCTAAAAWDAARERA